ncbi:MFS transporter [Streptomyces aureocirculatus]|uniref:MFS transporter n=1 Tax=Streptomyces aureocirculatus TaxID=67275 RepID=UPI00068A43AB|nr:MFS transporter [Streptomyces aureocirculatus]
MPLPVQPAPSATSRAPAGRTALLVSLSAAAMVVSMMQTLLVPILGLIQTSLHSSASAVSWVNTATLLSAAVFTPLLSRLGDQHGRKRVLVAVIVVLLAGSLLAALTQSLPLLIVARVLQGSATAIFPLALAILRREVPPERLAGAMALVSGMLGIGSGLALVLSGLLTQGADADYRRVFWLSVGLAAVILVASVLWVPADRDGPGGRTDLLGALTFSASLALLLLPVSQGREWGWTSGRTLGCFAAAVLAAIAWWMVEKRVREPMIDLPTFVLRPVLSTNVAGLLVGFVMFAQFIALSFLAQIPASVAGYGFGASALRAAVQYLLPGTAFALVAAPFGGILVKRHGPRLVLGLSGVLGALGSTWLAVAHDTTASVIAASAVNGTAISFAYAAMPALIVSGVPPEKTGIANGINSISRSGGSAIGSAVITTLMTAKTLDGLPSGVPALPAESQFTLTFVLGIAAWLLVVLVTAVGLPRGSTPPPAVAHPSANGGRARLDRAGH